jgi:hypothetical protein
LTALLEALKTEQQKRARQFGREVVAGGARERLIAKLDRMAERMRAAPDWIEPTAAEKARHRQKLEARFRSRKQGPGVR